MIRFGSGRGQWNGEKWIDSGYILKGKLDRIASGSNMEMERNRGIKEDD